MKKNELKNFLEKNEYKIENEKKFLELVGLIAIEKQGYLFRGMANSKWKIESSFSRKKDITNKENTLFYFEQRIKLIREKYFEKDNLILTSQMQHSKIETILIDFTSNFYHALWFAFSKLKENIELIKKQKILKYRSLYLLENNKKIFYEIKDWKEKNRIYKCPLNNKRGISQKSYFIIDNQDWNKNNHNLIKINIDNKLSKPILKFLINKKITASTIFPDLEGLNLEHETWSKYSFLEKGNIYQMKEQHNKAIEFFNKAIELDPNFDSAYNNKGFSLLELKKFDKAIELFKKAIKINPKCIPAYCNIIATLKKLWKNEEAEKWFEKTKKLFSNNKEPCK